MNTKVKGKNELEEYKELVLFENSKIRRKEYNNEWYYSIVDIIEILTKSNKPRDYWYRLKKEWIKKKYLNCRQIVDV